MSAPAASARYDATVGALGPIRDLVAAAVEAWGHTDLLDDAVLCASELASNAILHTRLPFEVVVSQRDGGVRVEVVDQRPTELPATVPDTGLATDITRQGTTGRGLLIVARLSDRWGVTTAGDRKTVWAELRNGAPTDRTPPTVEVLEPPTSEEGRISLRFPSLPVRPAVASGVHLDGLVREVQLGVIHVDDATAARLYQLLDASAVPRLEGRRGALAAASRDEPRYDLEIETTRESLEALGGLHRLITQLGADRRASRLPPGVEAFRAWLREESTRQAQGRTPRPCPLPERPEPI